MSQSRTQGVQLACLVGCLVLLTGAQARPHLRDAQSDADALLALKSAVIDFGRSELATWAADGGPPCPEPGSGNLPWPHIKCSDGRVTELNLEGLEIEGKLPEDLALATKLRTLDLSNNKFTGEFPKSWAGRARFSSLQTLNLAGNELEGRLPDWNKSGAWRALRVLDVSSNDFHGGLPASWLSKKVPLRKVDQLYLGGNRLGEDADGNPMPKEQWCQSEADAGLASGSGWCPQGKPLRNAAAKLSVLDLSDNGFTGPLPEAWPLIFPALVNLNLNLNSFSQLDASTQDPVPSVLPKAWTSPSAGFPMLSQLTLYPGNDYICSVVEPGEGEFQDINTDRTFMVVDDEGMHYGADNPMPCPLEVGSNTPPSQVRFTSKQAASWSYDSSSVIWGFMVTIEAWDAEGREWTSLKGGGWAGTLLRTYTQAGDGFGAADVAAQGLECAAGTCTLTFADMAADWLKVPVFSSPPDDVGKWRLDVATVGMNGNPLGKASAELKNQ